MSQEIQIPLNECSHGGIAHIGQTLIKGRLHWYRSTRCATCGNVEEDGNGFPPQQIRLLLLQDGGRWDVIADASVSRVSLANALRGLLGLSLQETAAKLRDFPVAYQGTQTEADWIRENLRAADIETRSAKSAQA